MNPNDTHGKMIIEVEEIISSENKTLFLLAFGIHHPFEMIHVHDKVMQINRNG